MVWGRRLADVQGLANELRLGASAAVVGGEPVEGLRPRVWIDEEEVRIEVPDRSAAPGVRVTRPDGFVAMWVTRDMAAAEALLREARELIAE